MSKTLLELKAAREALAAALAALTARNKQLAKVERDRASITNQVEQLETQTERSPEDADAVGRLATLREQQRLFDSKIARLQTEQLHDEGPRRALDEAQQAAGDLLIQSVQPELDGLLTEARAAFLPFYHDPARLQWAVERCDKVLGFKAHLTNAGAGLADEKAQRLLALLDRLIAGGDCGWTWQPLTAPATPPPAMEPTPAAAKHPARKLQAARP